ncbi:hypothetical protein DF268_08410 [Streptomyces sp. V2]|uniref:hypothetical protein n=1 Tax=Streptomyces sp. V2 TaxID=1424099 RepID=UPI000D66B340|nr:hypothetical protein [Streptomyces sp. V2]PWG13885.1 hypothetical protein DF268_08410 [Streptomyces sp. V2]
MNTTSVQADLADAMRQSAVDAGAGTPAVRGSNWQLATVTAVATDGTLTAAGISGIRRVARFIDPAVGDVVVISQSASGNWLALDRLATSVGEWTTLPLAGGFSAAAGYFAPVYRVIGREVQLRGSATKSTTLVSGDVWATLPVGARPTTDMDIVMGMTHGTNGTNYGACRGIIRTNGTIEYRGPSVSTLVFLSPMSFWLS